MVMCNSPWGFWKTCVASMDGQQSHGGTICCDTAEDLDFQEEDILKQCEYAKKEEITDVLLAFLQSFLFSSSLHALPEPVLSSWT